MAVIPAVKSAVKKVYGKPMQVASKVLGVATVASVLYDSHINGREKAYSNNEIKSADAFYNQYHQFMTCRKDSATLCKMKKWWFNVQQGFSIDNFAYKMGGYIAGVGRTVARELPVLALSALALIPKNPNINKAAGTLLVVNALHSFLSDVVGIGANKPERHY